MNPLIAVLNRKNQDATKTAIEMLRTLKLKDAQTYGISSPTTVKITHTPTELERQTLDSPIINGCASRRILKRDERQPLKLERATLAFDGRIYAFKPEKSLTQVFAQKSPQDNAETAKKLIKDIEGDFAFTIAESERLIAGRDSLGVRPLYFGQDKIHAALASQREVMWEIGMEPKSFPPGHIAFADRHSFRLKPVRTLAPPKPKKSTIQSSSRKLEMLLTQSVRQRTLGVKEVAVAFSGGLDSSIIAFLAKTLKADVQLIHVSIADQPETEHAKRAAEELKLPIYSFAYTCEDVHETLTKVIRLIEKPDPLDTNIGIPVYWTAEKAAEMNLNVMLAGQGADELFAGYKKYVDCYVRRGKKQVQQLLFRDISNLHKTNFERDFKICSFHGVELRLPFASYQLTEFANDLPVELKIERSEQTLRKLVLRQVAKNLGLPELIVRKTKKALQYSTGTNRLLKRIARQKGLSVNHYLENVFRDSFKR